MRFIKQNQPLNCPRSFCGLFPYGPIVITTVTLMSRNFYYVRAMQHYDVIIDTVLDLYSVDLIMLVCRGLLNVTAREKLGK
jgi:hypothetical protein